MFSRTITWQPENLNYDNDSKFINMVSKYVNQLMKTGSWEQKPNAIVSPGASTSLDLLLAHKKPGSGNHPKVPSIYRQRQRLERRIDPSDSKGPPRKGLGRWPDTIL